MAGSPRAKRWKRRIEESEQGLWLIGLASFLESTVVPIPLELILIPFMLARRKQAWVVAGVVTVGCLLGSLAGYGVGWFLMDGLGGKLVETMGWQDGMQSFQDALQAHGFWAVLTVGVTPVPFQSAMLASGAARYSLPMFLAAAAISRGLRYFGLALLVVLAGDRAEAVWENHAGKVGLVVLLLIVGAALIAALS